MRPVAATNDWRAGSSFADNQILPLSTRLILGLAQPQVAEAWLR